MSKEKVAVISVLFVVVVLVLIVHHRGRFPIFILSTTIVEPLVLGAVAAGVVGLVASLLVVVIATVVLVITSFIISIVEFTFLQVGPTVST